MTRAAAGLTGVRGGSSSIADIDNDGNEDLLITGDDGTNASATLYLGAGDGTFQEAGADLVEMRNGSTSIADIDNDGNQDILIAGQDEVRSPTTILYLGAGDGTFQEASAGLVEMGNGSTSIADIDNDGNEDLLITGDDGTNASATLYLGAGDGTFQEADADLTGVSGGSTSIADVDNDGNQDLLVVGYEPNGLNPTATLYLGSGDGTFQEASAGLTGVRGGSTSIADVDGDGNPDLLITGLDSNINPTGTLYLGDGQGSFSEANAGLTGISSGSTSIADVDSDGDFDLLITGEEALLDDPRDIPDDPSARLYVNRLDQEAPNRAPTFARTLSYNRPLAPGTRLQRTVEAGDLDGDSLSIRPASGVSNFTVDDRGNGTAKVVFTPDRNQGGNVADLSVEVEDSKGNTDLFSNQVDVPPYMAAFSAGLSGVRVGATSIADVNNDGNQDLLITGDSNPDTDNRDPTARLYLGNGNGMFSEASADLTGVLSSSTSIADVDNDGNQDLLVVGSDENGLNPTATLYLGSGDGSFQEAGAELIGTGGSTSIADVDDDGNQDLLITGSNPNSDPTAILYLGVGDGTFEEAGTDLTGVQDGSTSIADVDNDGNKDLLITGDNGTNPSATLYLGAGDGTFQEASAGLTGISRGSSSIADVDNDGNQDLLITGFDELLNRGATLYLGDGDGTFQEADAGLTGIAFGSTSIADFNGNGNQDILITGLNENISQSATLYLGSGDGSFQVASAGLAGVEFSSTSVADIDGDQDPDLLVTGFSPASLSVSSILYENLFANPLPVELALFEGATTNAGVRLTWQTASETNNAGFEVQRKEESGWSQMGFVESKAQGGTTTETQSYQFAVEDLPVGTHQFRLKQIDLDGNPQVHGPISVDVQMQEALTLSAPAPNPVSSTATLSFAVKEQSQATVAVYDMLGRKALTLFEGRPTPGESNRLQFDASGLPSGSYIIRLRADGQTETQRVTVVR